MGNKVNEAAESHEVLDAGNFNFVQVSRAYLKEWRALTRKSPIASEILMYLVENMGRTTNAVVCSYTTLMEVTAVSRASVARAVKLLKDDRWIEAIKIGNATAYCVNASAFWQAARNQKNTPYFKQLLLLPQLSKITISSKNLSSNYVIFLSLVKKMIERSLEMIFYLLLIKPTSI